MVLTLFALSACVAPAEADLVRFPTSTPIVVTATPPVQSAPERAAEAPAPTEQPVYTPTFVVPSLTPFPDDQFFRIGTSVEDRPIEAWQFGDGPRTIVLIGGIHGGYEANTVVLSEMLVNHFRSNPDDVLPGIRLVIIPAANPDGLERGSGLEGRFNAQGVDLNRNWGCDWAETAYLRDIEIDPGPRPFSEPESVALREYFVAEPPDAVIFYHSALGAIFMGACDDQDAADWMGELLSEATGYPYETEFTYYEVNGDATNWLAERGIPAAVIELYSRDAPEFEENLAGVIVLQCYYAALAPGFNATNPEYRRLCADG